MYNNVKDDNKCIISFAEMAANKYKYVVQVIICEQHGAGLRIGARCLWDADTDNYASDVFMNVHFVFQFIL